MRTWATSGVTTANAAIAATSNRNTRARRNTTPTPTRRAFCRRGVGASYEPDSEAAGTHAPATARADAPPAIHREARPEAACPSRGGETLTPLERARLTDGH